MENGLRRLSVCMFRVARVFIYVVVGNTVVN